MGSEDRAGEQGRGGNGGRPCGGGLGSCPPRNGESRRSPSRDHDPHGRRSFTLCGPGLRRSARLVFTLAAEGRVGRGGACGSARGRQVGIPRTRDDAAGPATPDPARNRSSRPIMVPARRWPMRTSPARSPAISWAGNSGPAWIGRARPRRIKRPWSSIRPTWPRGWTGRSSWSTTRTAYVTLPARGWTTPSRSIARPSGSLARGTGWTRWKLNLAADLLYREKYVELEKLAARAGKSEAWRAFFVAAVAASEGVRRGRPPGGRRCARQRRPRRNPRRRGRQPAKGAALPAGGRALRSRPRSGPTAVASFAPRPRRCRNFAVLIPTRNWPATRRGERCNNCSKRDYAAARRRRRFQRC